MLFIFLCGFETFTQGKFTTVSKGIEYGIFSARLKKAQGAKIHVLRIDPGQARLGLVLASEINSENRTASGWCRDYKMLAAINAGMFHKDYKTNVGYLRNGPYVQNKRWNKKYMSALAFNPKIPGIAPAVMVDLDSSDASHILENYNCIIQNLRLLKGNGVNVWTKSERRWSESAIGADKEGRILFIFCKMPYSMSELNDEIRGLEIGVTKMMHLEGGPLASFSVRSKNLVLDLAGSFEIDTTPTNNNNSQLPIPNAIGVFEK